MSPSPAEAKVLDPIEWTAMPPEYYWQNARSLTGPWKPKGEPEIGQAWYGPFKIDAQTNGRIEEMLRECLDLVRLVLPFVKRSIETLRLPGRIRGYRQAALREASGAP